MKWTILFFKRWIVVDFLDVTCSNKIRTIYFSHINAVKKTDIDLPPSFRPAKMQIFGALLTANIN